MFDVSIFCPHGTQFGKSLHGAHCYSAHVSDDWSGCLLLGERFPLSGVSFDSLAGWVLGAKDRIDLAGLSLILAAEILRVLLPRGVVISHHPRRFLPLS